MKFFAIGLWAIAAIATGYSLFYITFQVEDLESQLTQLNREILEEQEAVHVLKAEWSYLKRPSRIENLSAKLLPNLRNLSVEQIGALASLPERPVNEDDTTISEIEASNSVSAIPVSMESAQ